jgi:hypothetical protein
MHESSLFISKPILFLFLFGLGEMKSKEDVMNLMSQPHRCLLIGYFPKEGVKALKAAFGKSIKRLDGELFS